MSDPNDTVEDRFRKIALSLQSAVEADELWRELGSLENYNAYRSEIYDHQHFFQSVVELARSQVLSGLARFSDKSKSSLSIKELFKQLRSSGYDSGLIGNLEASYKENEVLWEKIRKIRVEALAHTSKTNSSIEVYEAASIQNDEISSCVENARLILLQIANLLAVNNSLISKPQGNIRKDCMGIFRGLKMLKEAEEKCT